MAACAARLFPVLTAGLHCGKVSLTSGGTAIGLLFPVLTAGLHCGLGENKDGYPDSTPDSSRS